MKYLLDTNTCIRFLNGRAPKMRTKVIEVGENAIAISSVTKAEMYYGSAKSQNPQVSRANQEGFFRLFSSLMFDDNCALVYGDIRSMLEREGQPIGANDMLIAAIALNHKLILVTHNTKEFGRIADLSIEDWE